MAYVEMRSLDSSDESKWFGCQWATWDLLIGLGERHGWKPRGTQGPADHLKDWEKRGGFQPTYDCEDFPLAKQVTREDATAWADALDLAARELGQGILQLSGPGTRILSERYHLEVLTHLEYGVKASFVSRFAAFLRRGSFVLLWEDGGETIPRNTDQPAYMDWFDFALAAFQCGDLAKAVEVWENLSKTLPDATTIWQNLGLAYRQLGLHDKAIAAHTQSTRLAPEDPEAWRILGNSLLEAGRNKEAVTALERSTVLDPSQASGWSGLGNAHSRAGAYVEAVEAHGRAVGLAPGDPNWVCNLAVTLSAMGDRDGAIACLKPMADRHPEIGAIQENMGTYLMEAKRFEEAVPYLRRASDLEPRDPMLWRRQVICHLELGEPSEAKRCLLVHLDLEPDFIPGWGLLLDLEPSEDEIHKARAKLAE